jgi:hypothetical protein
LSDDEHTTVAAALHRKITVTQSEIAMSSCKKIDAIYERHFRSFGKFRSRRRGRQLDASTSTKRAITDSTDGPLRAAVIARNLHALIRAESGFPWNLCARAPARRKRPY